MEEEIFQILIQHGLDLVNSPRTFVEFSRNQAADELLNNLEDYPHAFFIACLFDRMTRSENAWQIPLLIFNELNDRSFNSLLNLGQGELNELIECLQIQPRFKRMTNDLYSAIQKIHANYNDNASNIWNGNLSSATVVLNFLKFDGVGSKIGSMAANILKRNYKVPFIDCYSIDISVDTHVKRVFKRLGLVEQLASDEKIKWEIIYKARSSNPDYPGIYDYHVWQIGRMWCHERIPLCEQCYLNQFCHYRNHNN
jgi:endonuclease III